MARGNRKAKGSKARKPSVSGGKIGSFFKPARKPAPVKKPAVSGGKIGSFFKSPPRKSPTLRKSPSPRKLPTPSQFTRGLPTLSSREIDRYIRAHKGTLTQAQISGLFGREKSRLQRVKDKTRATEARAKFRPRKSERGKIVFVSPKGKRGKGKGYPVYVTRTGKKWLLKQPTDRPFASQRKAELKIPLRRNLRKAQSDFERAKLVTIRKARIVTRGRGSVSPSSPHDFSDSVVSKIARSLKKTIEGQASKRSFVIDVNLLLKHSDGSTSATSFSVPIDKADHISIRLAGLENFTRQKFYAFLARSLQYAGFISAGSAAHIEAVTGESISEDVWEQYHADAGHAVGGWSAPRFEVVRLEKIEWRMHQAK